MKGNVNYLFEFIFYDDNYFAKKILANIYVKYVLLSRYDKQAVLADFCIFS